MRGFDGNLIHTAHATDDLKMTDEELKQLVASLAIDQKEMAKESDKRNKETDKLLKELGKQIGGLGKKFGSFPEGLALPSMTKGLSKNKWNKL